LTVHATRNVQVIFTTYLYHLIIKPNDTGHAKTAMLLHKNTIQYNTIQYNTIVRAPSVPKKGEISKVIVCMSVHLEIRFNYPLEQE